jgi:hypothetical protein
VICKHPVIATENELRQEAVAKFWMITDSDLHQVVASGDGEK